MIKAEEGEVENAVRVAEIACTDYLIGQKSLVLVPIGVHSE